MTEQTVWAEMTDKIDGGTVIYEYTATNEGHGKSDIEVRMTGGLINIKQGSNDFVILLPCELNEIGRAVALYFAEGES